MTSPPPAPPRWRRILDWWKRRSALGYRAETAALRYLKRQGYRPLGRNLRAGRGEIDLLFSRRGTLVFVEVRCRSGGFGAADRSFDRAKRRHFARAIARYRAAKKLGSHPWRGDLVLARPEGKGFELAHRVGVIGAFTRD
jgi:putative endonuclease